jgi:uncharacterized membrane protein
MKKNNVRLVSAILFYGAIWGIVEASVGYVLHFLPTLIAGTILFPFVSVILYKAYRQTESSISILAIGVIAALIKSVNFFLPVLNIWKVINPMASILFESLIVMVLIKVALNGKAPLKIGAVLLASVSWRAIFLAYMGIQMLLTGFTAPQIASLSSIMSFSVGSGLLSGAMAVGMLALASIPIRKTARRFNPLPIVSFATLALAIVLTLVL